MGGFIFLSTYANPCIKQNAATSKTMNHTLRLPLGGLGRRFRLRHLLRIIKTSLPYGMSHRLICNAYAALSLKRRTAPCDARLGDARLGDAAGAVQGSLTQRGLPCIARFCCQAGWGILIFDICRMNRSGCPNIKKPSARSRYVICTGKRFTFHNS